MNIHASLRAPSPAVDTSLLGALGAIVDRAHVTVDRGAMTPYAWNGGVGAMPGPKLIDTWPIAVVWPQTTEQVAAIVRLCAARRLKFSAHSTGVGAFMLSREPNTVVMDLCRMEAMEIDPVSQTAVIQPGVTAGRLMAEAMKHGLTTHVVGAGPPHSPLASATSMMGIGITGSSTGHNARNMLSIEWVTPTGDIVRFGTTGDDWFSDEGPGPGLRGMVRGLVGAQSGLGVFTRIGYKLYPWAGPRQLQTTGRHPQIGLPCSETMRFFCPVWEDVEGMRDGGFRLIQSGVGFAILRIPTNHVGWMLSLTNGQYFAQSEAGELPEIARLENRFGWQVLTVGHSVRQAEYQDAVVRKIVAETGGRMLEVAQGDAEVLILNLVTSAYVGRVFRGAGSGGTGFGVLESFALLPNVYRAGEQVMEKERQPGGAFASDGKEGFWSWPTENRTLWSECIMATEANTGKGISAMLVAFLGHFALIERDPRLGVMAFLTGPLVDLFGPGYSRVNDWMRRIQALLDPRDTAHHTMYITPRKPAFASVWRLTQGFLFSRLGRPVLRLATNMVGRTGDLKREHRKSD